MESVDDVAASCELEAVSKPGASRLRLIKSAGTRWRPVRFVGFETAYDLPPSSLTLRAFGQDLMRWGSGSQMARNRMATLTASELQVAGVTVEMAENWALASDIAARLMPDNPQTAAGRADLVRHAANLLRGA